MEHRRRHARAPRPTSRPGRPSDVAAHRSTASSGSVHAAGQRARPELRASSADGRGAVGAQGLEPGRGPRRGRDGGRGGRARRRSRPGPAGAARARRRATAPWWAAPRSDGVAPPRAPAAAAARGATPSPRSWTMAHSPAHRRRDRAPEPRAARLLPSRRRAASIEWDQKQLPALMPHAELVDRSRATALLEARPRALPAARRCRPCPRLRAQVIHNDVTLDNLLFDAGRGGERDHRLRRHGAHRPGAGRPGHAPVARPRPHRPLRRGRRVPGGLHLGRARWSATRRSSWATCWPADGADHPHLRLADPTLPGQRLHHRLGGAGLGAAAAAGGGRLRWGRLALGDAGRAHRRSGVPAACLPPTDDLLERRRRVLGSALAPLTYHRPLHLVRGSGTWMYDAEGRAYLDAYNNVPVVGHAHPRVAEAIGRQAATAEHQHPLPARRRGGAGRADRRQPARRARHGDVRELRQRGERPGLAPGDRRDRGARRTGDASGRTTA